MRFKAALRRFPKFEISLSESIFFIPPWSVVAGLVQDYITAGCLPGTVAKAKCWKEIYSVALKAQCGTVGSSVVGKGFLDTCNVLREE